jgi:PhnB protein
MSGNVPYKPAGYQSVIPYLHVNGAAKMIAFLKEVFGAAEIAIYPRPDGTVGHAALRIGIPSLNWQMVARNGQPCLVPCKFTFQIPDAAYHRALKAGASSLQEPATQFYGDRVASIRDSCGNNWYIAT